MPTLESTPFFDPIRTRTSMHLLNAVASMRQISPIRVKITRYQIKVIGTRRNALAVAMRASFHEGLLLGELPLATVCCFDSNGSHTPSLTTTTVDCLVRDKEGSSGNGYILPS